MYGHTTGVVIFTPETAGTFDVWVLSHPRHPGQNHACYPAHATEESLPCGLYEESMGLKEIRVRSKPSGFPTNISYTLAFYTVRVRPSVVGVVGLFAQILALESWLA